MSPRPAWRMEERARPTESAAARSCPRCGTPFFSGKVGHLDAMGCGKCGGLWLDNAGSSAVLGHYDIDAAQLASQVDANAAEGASPLAAATPVTGQCPCCRTALQSVSYEGISLDFCAQHGTFFDRGELARLLQRAVASSLPAAPASAAPTLTADEVRHELYRHDDPVGTAIRDWVNGSPDWVKKWWT
jgi:Zn-finger nucleic acid-binding protein